MTSPPYIDEFFFDRDILTPNLHIAGITGLEPYSDMRPEQLVTDWLLESVESWGPTVDDETTLGQRAATGGSLDDYLIARATNQADRSYATPNCLFW